MTAKEWLNRGRRLREEIRALERVREDLRRQAESVTASPRDVIVQSTSDPHAKMDRLVILEEQITARIMELADAQAEILDVIRQLNDCTLRILLIRRYISGMTWERIMKSLNYSWSQIHRLHNRALTAVDEEMRKRE